MGEPARKNDQYDVISKGAESIGYHVSQNLIECFDDEFNSVSAAILNYVDSNQGITLLRDCADPRLATRVTEAVDFILDDVILADAPPEYQTLCTLSFLAGLTQGVQELKKH